jgi:hypothetical protein
MRFCKTPFDLLKWESMTSSGIIPSEQNEKNILTMRGYRIMMDSDLAVLYGVSTKVLNQAVKRNIRNSRSSK